MSRFPLPVAGILLSASVVSVQAQTAINLDTGVSSAQCIETGTAVLHRCDTSTLVGQDGQLGRDVNSATNGNADGALGFSFRKICNSGQKAGEGTCPSDPALGAAADEWACTEDKLTGMIWEVKTTSGLRAASNTYTNYTAGYNPKGQFRSATDASGLVDRVNAQGLCGASDWAIGHVAKIQTALHYGRQSGVAVDPAYLPNMLDKPYWSSSLNPSNPTTGWTMNYLNGSSTNVTSRDLKRHVLLVRGKGSLGSGADTTYEISADGTEVAQTSPGALSNWRRCSEGLSWSGATCVGEPMTFTMEDALRHAAAIAASTGADWHVPSVKELVWITRREKVAPSIDRTEFPKTPVGLYCTSTPNVRKPSETWLVDFEFGRIISAPRDTTCLLRLAR